MKKSLIIFSSMVVISLVNPIFAAPQNISHKGYYSSKQHSMLATSPMIKQLVDNMVGKWKVSGVSGDGTKIYTGMVYTKEMGSSRTLAIKYYASSVGINDASQHKIRKAFMVMQFPGDQKYIINSYRPDGTMMQYDGTISKKDNTLILSSSLIKTSRGVMRIAFTITPINKKQNMQKFYVLTGENAQSSQVSDSVKPMAYMVYTRITGKKNCSKYVSKYQANKV